MGWRRQQSHLRVVPRADDGSPVIGPDEAAEIQRLVKAELAVREDQRFDVVEYNRRYNAELARRAEVAVLRQARSLPVKAAAATAAAGTGGWGVAALAEMLAGPAGHLIATAATPTVAAVGLLAVRLAHGDRITEWSRTFTVSAVGGVGLATAAIALGPPAWPLLGAVLVAGAAGVSSRWMRAHTVPVRRPLAVEHHPAPELLPAGDLDEGGRIAARWASEVISPGGPIPRAERLTDRHDLDRGYRWTVQLGRGDYFSKVSGLREAVAAALHLPTTAVLLEPYPGDASRALLTVITRDALADGVTYLGALYHDGRIPIGLYADGASVAEIIIKDAGGVYPTAMTGDPRTGKSTAFEAMAVALRQSGEWMVLFGDGDPGAGSSSIMAEVAHWPEAGPRGALRQLECLEALLVARQAIKATLTVDPGTGLLVPITDPARQRPAAKILPCPQFPGWIWMIDELHIFMRDEWLAQHNFGLRLETWTRTAPKYGMIPAVATHSRLNPDYRTSTFKGLVHARNSLAFRAESSSERASINGVLVTPSELPHGGGYAYATHGGRVATLRTGYPVELPAEPFPQVTPDADSWLAVGPFWPEEEQDPASAYRAAEKRRAEWRRRAEARARGEEVPVQPPAVPAPTVAASGYPQFDALASRLPGLVQAAKVLPFRRPDVRVTDERLTDAERAFLNAIHQGHTRSFQIIHHTGLPGPRVSNIGRKLAGMGLVVDGGHGLWTLPSDKAAGQ